VAAISRYRVAVEDVDRETNATLPRRLPGLTGTFRHVVAEGERLDQLAYRYYGDPLLWWRICDANPDVLSPLDLIGQEPLITRVFAVDPPDQTAENPEDPWPPLLCRLSTLVGVEGIDIEETLFDATLVSALRVTYNRCENAAVAECVIQHLGCAGFKLRGVAESGRVGRAIVIPPLGAG
jgi:Phage Tail Protein X